jgi:tetratricopeptide (TPR) repeat protein
VEHFPGNPVARYYYGRFLLLSGDNQEGLVQLRKAADLAPQQADYLFWAGLAAGENGQSGEEEQRYRAALAQDPDHLQSLLYLGHNRLAAKDYNDALGFYERALHRQPTQFSALYNKALILNKLGRSAEERKAWQHYLALYPDGSNARQATSYLNALDDFSFRNHRLGARTITMEKIHFIPFTAQLHPASHDSLRMIGTITANRRNESLQILAYQINNKALAHDRAVAVKTFLLEEFPAIEPERIGISWFDVPQEVKIKKKKILIEESIDFFMVP